MDKVVDKIAALGVPGLVLLVSMSATGWAGAAATTTALAMLGGPLGMLGGIGALIIIALISKALAQYGFERIFKATVTKLHSEGLSKDEIRRKVDSYPISATLKLKVNQHLESVFINDYQHSAREALRKHLRYAPSPKEDPLLELLLQLLAEEGQLPQLTVQEERQFLHCANRAPEWVSKGVVRILRRDDLPIPDSLQQLRSGRAR